VIKSPRFAPEDLSMGAARALFPCCVHCVTSRGFIEFSFYIHRRSHEHRCLLCATNTYTTSTTFSSLWFEIRVSLLALFLSCMLVGITHLFYDILVGNNWQGASTAGSRTFRTSWPPRVRTASRTYALPQVRLGYELWCLHGACTVARFCSCMWLYANVSRKSTCYGLTIVIQLSWSSKHRNFSCTSVSLLGVVYKLPHAR